jgi:hypothetical protein
MDEDGSVGKMLYKEIKEHEEFIIKDNIGYGLIHNEYSEEEIDEYEEHAYKELKELKQQIRENPNIILKLDKTTERFVVA